MCHMKWDRMTSKHLIDKKKTKKINEGEFG